MNEDSAAPRPAARYRGFVLGMLALTYLFNFVDRQLLVILQEPIKAELGLSDTQLGLLSGFAFALFYVSFGLPIARWADTGNRRTIISFALAVWSAMTVLCGLALNYWQLLLARIGVGIGEAGGSPPAHSMISDYYPLASRGRAMAIYNAGLYAGILVGSMLGGYLESRVGWRMTFVLMGVPGLALALVFRLTVREPPRAPVAAATVEPGLVAGCLALLRIPGFALAALGAGLYAFLGYGVGNFMPSFMIREHGLTVAQTGLWMGLIVGGGGAFGALAGGVLCDRLGRRDHRWYLWLPAITVLLSVPCLVVSLLVGSTALALVAYGLFYVNLSLYLGPTIALIHASVPARRRALSSALVFFILNLVGLGGGPLLVGALSDLLTPAYGVDGLRYALLAVTPAALAGVACYALAARRLKSV